MANVNGAIDGDAEDAISERDRLFNAYYENELDEAARADFEDRIESDEEFAEAYHAFFEVMGGLRELPFEFAPDDFVERVQSRIRTRSHGRFFAEELLFKTRIPYEVVAIVMIIVMAAAYLFMGTPPDRGMQDVDPAQAHPRLDVP